jgi:hypothetical protein
MGLVRSFTQTVNQVSGSTVNWPNASTISEAVILGTTPVLIAINRPGLNRRKMIIDNVGSSPVIFGFGGTSAPLTSMKRTGILNPGDGNVGDLYIDDFPIYQGEIVAALPNTGLPPGRLSVTEGLVII